MADFRIVARLYADDVPGRGRGLCETGIEEVAGATALTYAGIAATAVSTAVGVYSAVSAASAQADAARYNQKVADNQALASRQAADVAAAQIRQHTARVIGANRAAIGVSNVEGDTGSSLLVQIDNAQQGELNARLVEYQGATQSQGFSAQANLLRYQAGQDMTAGYLRAGTTLLSGAKKIGDSWPSSVPSGIDPNRVQAY